MKKKLLSLFLVFTLLVTAFPVGVFAAGEKQDEITNELNVKTVKIDGKSYVEIPIGKINDGVHFRKVDPNTPTKNGAGQKINAAAAIVWQMFDWEFPAEGFKAQLKIGNDADPRTNETIAEVQVKGTVPVPEKVSENNFQFITTNKYQVGDENKDLKLVFDNSFRANCRIAAGYDNDPVPGGKCYYIVVTQITMPAYTAEWYDNGQATRPTIKGVLYSAGKKEAKVDVKKENLKYGCIGTKTPSYVDENDINGNNIGMVDFVPTGNITEAQLTMSEGQNPVATGKFVSYVTKDVDPSDFSATETEHKLDNTSGKIESHAITSLGGKPGKTSPAYFYQLIGDNNHMWRFQMREVLNVKLNSGAGKINNAGEDKQLLHVGGKDAQEIGHSEKIYNNDVELTDYIRKLYPKKAGETDEQLKKRVSEATQSQRVISFKTDEKVTPPKVKVGDKEVDATFAGWATKAQTLTDGKLSAIEGQLVNADGSLTDAGKTYTFTKDETILYAVFEAEKPGKVNIKYVNETNGDLLKADPSVKIDNEGYPEDKTGIEGQVIEAALTNTSEAPKFIGYKIKSVKLQKGDQDTSDQIKYTKNGDYTVVFVYEKLDDIIPEKDDNGQPNPKVTEDVKKTYIPVTWKVDSEKGKFKKGEAAVAGTEFTYYVNPTKKKTFSNVVEESGLTAASKDENKYKIDTENPSTFNPEKVKATDEEQKPSLVVDNGTEINKLHFTVEKGLVVTVNFEQTKADQLKDKLAPETIKVWVDKNDTDGSKIDWKKGVKLKEDDKDLQKILDEDTTIVTDESNRNSSKQNLPDGKDGTLKVTFSDGSSIKVENQMLYVADHKVPIKDGDETNKINPDNLPTDKIAVKFLLGEGVKIGNDKVGDGTTPVLYETYYVKPNTSLEQGDIPATTLQENYRDNAWYNGTAKLAEADYKNITEAKEFIAKAEQTDAKKYGDQLKAQDIVKWVGDNVDWTKGVKPIKDVTFKSVEDQSSRNTTAAGVFPGKLKVTFNDDSTKELDNQKLIVRDKKGEKVTPDDKDPGTYPKDALEVKFVAGTGIKALDPANKVMVLKSGEKLEAADYPEVTVEENFKKMDNKTDYYDVEPGVITEGKTITASTTEVGNGTAIVKFVDKNNNPLDPKTDEKLQIAGENYDQTLSGKDGVAIVYDKSKAPKILGYKLTDKAPAISPKNFAEGKQATITLEYEKIDDIIPGEGNTRPDGYVTIKFTAQEGAKLTGETIYYVNPKAGKTLNDIKEPTVKSTDETKYEVKTGDDLWKPVLTKTDGITADKTFEAQVTKLGEPSATYPDVNIEKGETKTSNPTIKDKRGNDKEPIKVPEIIDSQGNPIPATDGKIIIGDPQKGIKLIPKADGQITVEVPKDYDGPNDVTVSVQVTIPEDGPIKTKLEIIIGKPEEPKPASPAITWKGYWYLGDSKTEPVQPKTDMEIGRHYKYLYGYVDKTVRPEGMITRSEAAALIARLANLDMTDKTKPNFKDTPSAWYNGAINAMVAKNLMFADKDGNFRPNEPITRGEFARALYYIDKKNDKVAPFADVKGHEFEDAINQAYGNGRIAGYQDGTFKPNANIQRAEAARILNQYADRNVTLAGMANVKNDLVRFTDINESHWAYCEVMEAANSHEYQRAKGTLAETWLRILDK